MKDSILQKVVGYLLLIPPLISVVLFVLQIYMGRKLKIFDIDHGFMLSAWSGFITVSDGAFTSSLPFYLGIMAMAGAYLIKDTKKQNNKDL